MKKIKLSIAALFFSIWGHSQEKQSSSYEVRPLKIEEVNFVSGYYNQSGNHSAIGGGKGDETLNNFSNSLDVKLIKSSGRFQHNLNVNISIDHHTSASTKLISTPPTGATTTPYLSTNKSTEKYVNATSRSSTSGSTGSTGAISSASTLYGWRLYPSLNYSIKDIDYNATYGLGAYYSGEFDYKSWGGEISFAKASADNNTEFSIKGLAFFDKRQIILPVELATNNTDNLVQYSWKDKTSYSVNTAFSQVVNERLQFSLLADYAYQKGLLSIPYNRVYFTNNTVAVEKLPDTRTKVPIGLRLNYFAGNSVVFRTYYRYYWDDWGIKSHTASIEIPVKLSPNFSLSPFYRFHQQTANKYFVTYGNGVVGSKYYSSDYDLSGYNSSNMGLNMHYVPEDWGVFNSIDIRYSYYKRTDGMSANNLTLAFTFK